MKTLIQNGLVLLRNGTDWVLKRQDVLVDGNRIARIAPGR